MTNTFTAADIGVEIILPCGSTALTTETLVAGGTSITTTVVTGAAWFIGQLITVDTTGTPDKVTITGISGTTLYTTPLAYAHASGAVVVGGYLAQSGAVAHMLVQLQANPTPAHSSYLATLDASGAFATYFTLGTEFTTGGIYNIWLQITGSGYQYTSKPYPQIVNAPVTP